MSDMSPVVRAALKALAAYVFAYPQLKEALQVETLLRGGAPISWTDDGPGRLTIESEGHVIVVLDLSHWLPIEER